MTCVTKQCILFQLDKATKYKYNNTKRPHKIVLLLLKNVIMFFSLMIFVFSYGQYYNDALAVFAKICRQICVWMTKPLKSIFLVTLVLCMCIYAYFLLFFLITLNPCNVYRVAVNSKIYVYVSECFL